MWEQRADELNQSMLFLMNLKNNIAKKDLRLAYSQGNNIAYPTNIGKMARYLSTQYPDNKPANQGGSKKGDKKKGNNSKSEDKDSNIGGTTGVHVEDATTTEESTAPSGMELLVLALRFQKQMYSHPAHRVLWRRFWEHAP